MSFVMPKIYQEYSLSASDLQDLKNTCEFIDIFDVQKDEYLALVGQKNLVPSAFFVHLSSQKKLLRMVDKATYFALRTNRNKNLITEAEQLTLSSKRLGVLGMSVGSTIAIGAVQAGIASTIKIADFDDVSNTNLNRLRVPLWDIGRSKAQVAAEQIYSVDPYTTVELYDKGVSDDNIDAFFGDGSPLDAIVDEIDDFRMKSLLRVKAREKRIPVIMMTSLGDSILVDVERFDQEPDRKVFHGILGTLPEELLEKNDISDLEIKQLSVKLVGAEYVPTRALESLPLMGKELNGRPQLYSTIAIDGGLAVYILREIFMGHDFPSGRYHLDFGKLFGISDSSQDQARRDVALSKLGLI